MFDDNYSGTVGPMKECRPDYEKQIAKFRQDLADLNAFEKAVRKFRRTGYSHRFHQCGSMAELVGGVSFIKEELENNIAVAIEAQEANNG